MLGQGLRSEVPRSSHAVWDPPAGRTDPVERLTSDSVGRIPELVPLRNGRMIDLPVLLLPGQRLGDGRGPGLDTLDGTPGPAVRGRAPVELRRLRARPSGAWSSTSTTSTRRSRALGVGPQAAGTSLAVAGRDRGFDDRDRRHVVQSACAAYRRGDAGVRPDGHAAGLVLPAERRGRPRPVGRRRPARRRSEVRPPGGEGDDQGQRPGRRAADAAGGRPGPDHQRPPAGRPGRRPDRRASEFSQFDRMVTDTLRSYRRTLPASVRHLLEQFRYGDVARKVVGVGSVGTRTWAC